MRRCARGAKSALDALPKIWPPDAPGASAAALGQIKICGDGVSLKVQRLLPRWPCMLSCGPARLRASAQAPPDVPCNNSLCIPPFSRNINGVLARSAL